MAGGAGGLQAGERLGQAARRLRVECGGQLAQGAELCDQLAASTKQILEKLQVGGLWRGRLQVGETAAASQHGRIDAVVVGELAEGCGEAPRAQGVDKDSLQTSCSQALVQLAVVAPGGFEDGACDAVLEQPVAQSAATACGVCIAAVEAGVKQVGVQVRLTASEAGDYEGSGCGPTCIAILLRYGSCTHACVQGAQEWHATGRPRWATDLQSEVETVRPVAAGGAWPGPPGSLLPALRRAGNCERSQRWLALAATMLSEAPQAWRPFLVRALFQHKRWVDRLLGEHVYWVSFWKGAAANS